MLKVIVESNGVYSNLTKQDPLSTMKTFCINSFLNLKIEQLQKTKTIWLIKLIVVTVKESTLLNLNGLLDEHERSATNFDCYKSKIAKHCWEVDHNFSWDQKKVVNRESRLIPRKIKETIRFLMNSNYINIIYHLLSEILLPNLWQFLITYLCHIRKF